jgi:hypothetical protein
VTCPLFAAASSGTEGLEIALKRAQIELETLHTLVDTHDDDIDGQSYEKIHSSSDRLHKLVEEVFELSGGERMRSSILEEDIKLEKEKVKRRLKIRCRSFHCIDDNLYPIVLLELLTPRSFGDTLGFSIGTLGIYPAFLAGAAILAGIVHIGMFGFSLPFRPRFELQKKTKPGTMDKLGWQNHIKGLRLLLKSIAKTNELQIETDQRIL